MPTTSRQLAHQLWQPGSSNSAHNGTFSHFVCLPFAATSIFFCRPFLQVARSLEYVQAGTTHLVEAKRLQRNTRKLMCCALICLLLVLVAVALAVAIPLATKNG